MSVDTAFNKQSVNYDAHDIRNTILQDLRRQVYAHVARWIRPHSHILELNAGTGIDALHFVGQGHIVYATDLSAGMIAQIRSKIEKHSLQDQLTCQQLSYDNLDSLAGKKFDYVFSNFGGLNCIQDLTRVTQHLPQLLNKDSYVTWVIMPPVCPWELLWFLKGHFRAAFRRFNRDGVMAHIEGEYFKTYYHSVGDAVAAFGDSFEFIDAEGLATFSPPPSRGDFPGRYRRTYAALRRIDSLLRHLFPFNRWGDHVIVTFKFKA